MVVHRASETPLCTAVNTLSGAMAGGKYPFICWKRASLAFTLYIRFRNLTSITKEIKYYSSPRPIVSEGYINFTRTGVHQRGRGTNSEWFDTSLPRCLIRYDVSIYLFCNLKYVSGQKRRRLTNASFSLRIADNSVPDFFLRSVRFGSKRRKLTNAIVSSRDR